MNRFILALFVCLKSVYAARLITRSADIFSRCSHTDIRTKNSESPKQKPSISSK